MIESSHNLVVYTGYLEHLPEYLAKGINSRVLLLPEHQSIHLQEIKKMLEDAYPTCDGIVTNSIFAIRELIILQSTRPIRAMRWIKYLPDGTFVSGPTAYDIGTCDNIDAELDQAERYLMLFE